MSTENAERIIGGALKPVRGWWIFILVVALLSAVRISWKPGEPTVTFEVSAVTAAIIALAWLPAVLRVIAWTGGSFKTAAGEASSTGFLSVIGALPEGAQLLGSLSAALDDAEKGKGGPRKQGTGAALDAVREQLTTAVSRSGSPMETELSRLARDYETTRHTMEPGTNRTRVMSALIEQAQAVVRASSEIDDWLTDRLSRFDQLGDGERVMTLAALRARPRGGSALEAVQGAILKARSPFEQYQALRAAESLVPVLDIQQRQELRSVVVDALAGKASPISLANSDRDGVARDLLRQLG